MSYLTNPFRYAVDPCLLNTDFSGDTGWTFGGSGIEISSNLLNFVVEGRAANNGSQAYYDLGSGVVDTDAWNLRFTIQSTGTAINGNSAAAMIDVGLFSGSNVAGSSGVGGGVYSPTQNFFTFRYVRVSGTSDARAGGSDDCGSPYGCGETNDNVDIGEIVTVGSYSYVEIKKTAATSITCTLWSDDYEGTVVGTTTQNSGVDTSNVRYIKIEAYHESAAAGQTNTITGQLGEMKFYNASATNEC